MSNSQKVIRNSYINLLAGRAIDVLQSTDLTPRGGANVDVVTNEAIKEVDGIKIILGNYGRVAMNVQARKLLDIVLCKLTGQIPYTEATAGNLLRARTVTIKLKDFMSICGLKDRQNAVEQFRAAARALMNISLTFDYEKWEKPKTPKGRRKKIQRHFSGYLFECTNGIRNFEDEIFAHSRIEFNAIMPIIEYLCARRIRPINIKMFAINPHKYPHGYNIARKLTDYYNLNAKKPGQFVRLSVGSLIACCPELPKPEEIRDKGNREYWQKIYEPVQRDLDAIADIYGIVDQHYCHRGGEPLTDEELSPDPKKGYKFNDWLEFLIEYTLPDYPIMYHH